MSKLEMLELAKAKEYLSFKDVVLLSNLSESTIRRNINEGRLKSIQRRPSQRMLFKKSDVVNWIEKGYEGHTA